MSLLSQDQPPNAEQTRWFAEEVHAHEASLKAYLRSAFPSVHDVDDVVHESYMRLWRRHLAKPIILTRAFLFQVARHVAIDGLRRNHRSPVNGVGDLSSLNVIEDRAGVPEVVSLSEKIRFLSEALATLPPRGREILILRKFEGLSQKQVAARLGISEKTVDEHVARGIKRLGRYLRNKGVASYYD